MGDKTLKRTWRDVTLGQFLRLQDLLAERDEYTLCNIIDLIYGTDSANMPLTEFSRYRDAVSFLDGEVKRLKRMPSKVTLGGTEYMTGWDLSVVTTAQYIDYQNYCRRAPVSYADLLSVFVIPEGHVYNDGYDMAKVREDVLLMPVDYVVTLTFFFARQLALFTAIFPTCFREEVKKMEIPEERKTLILKELDKQDFSSLASFLTSAG